MPQVVLLKRVDAINAGEKAWYEGERLAELIRKGSVALIEAEAEETQQNSSGDAGDGSADGNQTGNTEGNASQSGDENQAGSGDGNQPGKKKKSK